MYLSHPNRIKQFSEIHFKKLRIHKKRIVAELIMGVLLCNGKRTFEALSKVFLDSQKNKTSIRSFFETQNFRSKDIHKSTISSILSEVIGLFAPGALYTLLFDGTCMQRGGDTLVENAIKYREKKNRGKGKQRKRSTKSHNITMGLLILPNGMRIPMPRYTYYSKNYCRKHKMKYYTQHEYACMLIEYCRGLVPKEGEFVVVADGFYDSRIIFDTCKTVNAKYITVADSGRVYAPKKKLYEKGLKAKKNSQTLIIKKGEEKYAREHFRYASPASGKKKDLYQVASEILNFPKLGEIRVVYSWKKNNKGKSNSNSYKILLCSDINFCDRKIVELYALRWQIEIYFRELKSEIGLCDYSGKEFRACERFIDICLLAYLFLEWDRSQKLKEEKSKKEKGKIKLYRTKGLITLLRKSCLEENKLKIFELKNISLRKKAA